MHQPFLSILEQAATQTGNYTGYEDLLQEQQSAFMKYIQRCFNSDLSAPKRFQFLRTADFKLDELHLKYAKIVQEKSAHFYHFWSMLIVNTRRFIAIDVETLEFQRKCPAHMLVEPDNAHTFPPCNWAAQRTDLLEAIFGIFQADVIRLKDGSRSSFTLFAQEIGNIFGITINHPHDEMRKVLSQKKSDTVFQPCNFSHEGEK